MALNRVILGVLFLVSPTLGFWGCSLHGKLTAEGTVGDNVIREGDDLHLTLVITDPTIDQDKMWLKLTHKEDGVPPTNLSYITPDRLANDTVRWTIPNVTELHTGSYYVKVPAEIEIIVACLTIHVGRPPSFAESGAPAEQTDFYCVTYNYLNTSCFWHTGPDTNIPTNYTLYYARSVLVSQGFLPCEPHPDGVEEGAGGRVLKCDPKYMTDLNGASWIYDADYVFFIVAQNILGTAKTGNQTHPYIVIDMLTALQTSPALEVTVPPALTPTTNISWGWPHRRVHDQYQLIGEVTYAPKNCHAGRVVRSRSNMTQEEGGEASWPSGVTPGLNYDVSVRLRSRLTFVWDRDVYWSTAVNRFTHVRDQAPTGNVSFRFHDSADIVAKAIPIVWEDVSCEERGSLATRFQVEVTGGPLDSPHTEDFAAGTNTFSFKDSWVIPNAEYWVRMRGVNDVGPGPWSDRRHHRTNPTTLEQPPRDVAGSDITADGMVVTWRGSEYPYSAVTHYRVSVTHVQTGEKVQEEEVLAQSTPPVYLYHVAGLEGGSLYNVSVAECAKIHCGQDSPPLPFTTRVGAPSNVTVLLDTNADEAGEIRVTWNTPRPANGPVKLYQVNYYSGDGSVEETVDILANISSWFTVLDCDTLEADEKILVRVRAVNENATGQLLEGMWSAPVEKPVCSNNKALSAEIIGVIAGLTVLIIVIVTILLARYGCQTKRHLQKERDDVPSDFAPPALGFEQRGLPTPPEERVPSQDSDVDTAGCTVVRMDQGYPDGVSVSPVYGTGGDQSKSEDLGYPNGVSVTEEAEAPVHGTKKSSTSYPELSIGSLGSSHGTLLSSETTSGCSSGGSPPEWPSQLGDSAKTRHISNDSGILNPQHIELQALRVHAVHTTVPEITSIKTFDIGYAGALPENPASSAARQESHDSGLPTSGGSVPPSPAVVEEGEGYGSLETDTSSLGTAGDGGAGGYPDVVVDKPSYGLLDVTGSSGDCQAEPTTDADTLPPVDVREGLGYGLLDDEGGDQRLPPPTVVEGDGYNYGLLEEDSWAPCSPEYAGAGVPGGGYGVFKAAGAGAAGYPSTSSDVLLLGDAADGEEAADLQVFDDYNYGALDVSRKPDPSLDASVHTNSPVNHAPSSDHHDSTASHVCPLSPLPSTTPLLPTGETPLTSSGSLAVSPPSVESGDLPRAESGDFLDVTAAEGCATGIPGQSLAGTSQGVEPSENPAKECPACSEPRTKPLNPPRQNSFSFSSAGRAKPVGPLTLVLDDFPPRPPEVSTRPVGFSAWGVSAGPKCVFPGDKEYVPDIPQHFLNPPDIHIEDLPVTPL